MRRPPPRELDDALVEQLVTHAASWTGFRADAVRREAVLQAARVYLQDGVSPDELLALAARAEPALVAAFQTVVSVGETYFFRQPDHFRFVAEELHRRLAAGRTAPFRAWSAGCATGEEPYSLAACLVATASGRARVEVLGTDLLAKNLEAARVGVYGRWSVREAGPLLYPVLDGPLDARRVLPAVREVTRFKVHNLLHPPPDETRFDAIFCRNVLVYFSPESIRIAVEHLCSRLAPDGVIAFGTLDVDLVPAHMQRVGPAELNVFRNPEHPVAPKARPAARPTLAVVPRPVAAPLRAPEPVAVHLRALAAIERGDRSGAQKALGELEKLAPEYLPGVLERALAHARDGHPERASALMRELLQRTSRLDPDELLAGPEPLPIAYYRASAEAFLGRKEARR